MNEYAKKSIIKVKFVFDLLLAFLSFVTMSKYLWEYFIFVIKFSNSSCMIIYTFDLKSLSLFNMQYDSVF